jgi:hypothetical protein
LASCSSGAASAACFTFFANRTKSFDLNDLSQTLPVAAPPQSLSLSFALARPDPSSDEATRGVSHLSEDDFIRIHTLRTVPHWTFLKIGDALALATTTVWRA